jgi:glycosyltransferase involved in cell wall biosynthesis
MKILYILGSYYPAQSGGPNNTIHWQAKYLTKNNHDITVASFKSGLTEENIKDWNIVFNTQNNIEGVKAHYFNFYMSRYFSIEFYAWIIGNIRNYEFVQLTSYFFPITWISVILCNIYNIPFSLAPRGELEDNALKYGAIVKKIAHNFLLKFIYKKAKFILVTSRQELEFSKKYFNKQMEYELIPNYIDLSSKKSLDYKDILDKKNILYLGRIHPKKGIENLITAYISLNKNFKEQHSLLIAGDGDVQYMNKLKELVLEYGYVRKIKFLGHQQGADKEFLYKKNKVFVLPSYSENFGNVVLESLSFSTPVIASKYTPWKELESYKCGFWIENTPNEIKIYLEKILSMNELEYVKYANNAYKFVNDEYNIDQNITKIENIYYKYAKSKN